MVDGPFLHDSYAPLPLVAHGGFDKPVDAMVPIGGRSYKRRV
jgi:hypothetical protein